MAKKKKGHKKIAFDWQKEFRRATPKKKAPKASRLGKAAKIAGLSAAALIALYAGDRDVESRMKRTATNAALARDHFVHKTRAGFRGQQVESLLNYIKRHGERELAYNPVDMGDGRFQNTRGRLKDFGDVVAADMARMRSLFGKKTGTGLKGTMKRLKRYKLDGSSKHTSVDIDPAVLGSRKFAQVTSWYEDELRRHATPGVKRAVSHAGQLILRRVNPRRTKFGYDAKRTAVAAALAI